MISANIRRLPSGTCHTPHATRRPPPAEHCPSYATSLSPPGAWRLQLSKSLDRACRSIHGSIYSSEIGSVFPLESVLGSVEPSRLGVYHRGHLGAYLKATRRCTWECLESLLGSVQSSRLGVSSSAIGSILESVLGNVLESVLRAYLGAYSQAGWECAIECN